MGVGEGGVGDAVSDGTSVAEGGGGGAEPGVEGEIEVEGESGVG